MWRKRVLQLSCRLSVCSFVRLQHLSCEHEKRKSAVHLLTYLLTYLAYRDYGQLMNWLQSANV